MNVIGGLCLFAFGLCLLGTGVGIPPGFIMMMCGLKLMNKKT